MLNTHSRAFPSTGFTAPTRRATPSTSSTAAAATTDAQLRNEAPIQEYECMYSANVMRKKQKSWTDGLLRLHTFNWLAVVFSKGGDKVGQAHLALRGDVLVKKEDGSKELEEGQEFNLDSPIAVQIVYKKGEVEQKREEVLRQIQPAKRKTPQKPRREPAGTSPTATAAVDKRSPISKPRPTAMPPPPRPVKAKESFIVTSPPRVSRNERQDQIYTSQQPKTLQEVLGEPKGRIGRAMIPEISPFDEKQAARKLQEKSLPTRMPSNEPKESDKRAPQPESIDQSSEFRAGVKRKREDKHSNILSMKNKGGERRSDPIDVSSDHEASFELFDEIPLTTGFTPEKPVNRLYRGRRDDLQLSSPPRKPLVNKTNFACGNISHEHETTKNEQNDANETYVLLKSKSSKRAKLHCRIRTKDNSVNQERTDPAASDRKRKKHESPEKDRSSRKKRKESRNELPTKTAQANEPKEPPKYKSAEFVSISDDEDDDYFETLEIKAPSKNQLETFEMASVNKVVIEAGGSEPASPLPTKHKKASNEGTSNLASISLEDSLEARPDKTLDDGKDNRTTADDSPVKIPGSPENALVQCQEPHSMLPPSRPLEDKSFQPPVLSALEDSGLNWQDLCDSTFQTQSDPTQDALSTDLPDDDLPVVTVGPSAIGPDPILQPRRKSPLKKSYTDTNASPRTTRSRTAQPSYKPPSIQRSNTDEGTAPAARSALPPFSKPGFVSASKTSAVAAQQSAATKFSDGSSTTTTTEPAPGGLHQIIRLAPSSEQQRHTARRNPDSGPWSSAAFELFGFRGGDDLPATLSAVKRQSELAARKKAARGMGGSTRSGGKGPVDEYDYQFVGTQGFQEQGMAIAEQMGMAGRKMAIAADEYDHIEASQVYA